MNQNHPTKDRQSPEGVCNISTNEIDEMAIAFGIEDLVSSHSPEDYQILFENPVVGPTLQSLSERVFGLRATPSHSTLPGSKGHQSPS